jgi:hypothetical protein
MVCRNAHTHKARRVNPLIISTPEEKALFSLGERTSFIRVNMYNSSHRPPPRHETAPQALSLPISHPSPSHFLRSGAPPFFLPTVRARHCRCRCRKDLGHANSAHWTCRLEGARLDGRHHAEQDVIDVPPREERPPEGVWWVLDEVGV